MYFIYDEYVLLYWAFSLASSISRSNCLPTLCFVDLLAFIYSRLKLTHSKSVNFLQIYHESRIPNVDFKSSTEPTTTGQKKKKQKRSRNTELLQTSNIIIMRIISAVFCVLFLPSHHYRLIFYIYTVGICSCHTFMIESHSHFQLVSF